MEFRRVLFRSLEVAEGKVAANVGQAVQLGDQTRVDLARQVEGEVRRAGGRVQLVDTAPVDDPVAGQLRNRQRCCRLLRRQIADDLAGESRKPNSRSKPISGNTRLWLRSGGRRGGK